MYKLYILVECLENPLSTTSRGFRWLWCATTGAALGDGLSSAVLPLLIASQTRDPFVVSLLQVATGLPWLLFGLVAGTLVDRWDRRAVMWRTDVARVVLAAALAGLVLLELASVPLILLVAFLLPTGATLIRSAAPALLPTLVDRDELAAANGRLQAGATVAGSFGGPAVGSGLYAISAALPLLAQTLSLAISTACVLLLPGAPARNPVERLTARSIRSEAREGLRWLSSHQVLRKVASGTALLAAATGILLAVLVLHVLEFLGLPPVGYGLMISVYAIGSVAGALLTAPVERRLGTSRCLLASALLGAGSIGALALAPAPVPAGGALLCLGVATMLWNTIAVTLRQELTPAHLLGRVSSAFNVVAVGAAPIAAPIGGVIAARFGTPVAIGTAAALCALACIDVARIPSIERTAAGGHDGPVGEG